MGVVIDHVPNHTAVGRPELNARWWAMLRDGPASDAARWFDVDWDGGRREGHPARCSARRSPTSPATSRSSTASCASARSAGRCAPGTEGLAPADALDRQHYRLQWWRHPTRNVRRFFTIDDLVGRARRGSRRRRGRRHRAAAARRPPRVRRRPRRPRRRAGRPARLPGGAAGHDRRPLAARREDPRRRRDAARGRGRSTARRATSTPRSSSTPCSTATGGRRSATAGSRSPVTTGRSGRGSWRPGARCSTAGCVPTSSAARAAPGWPTTRARRRADRAPRALPHVPARRGGAAGARRRARGGGRRPGPTWRRRSSGSPRRSTTPGEWRTRWQQLTGPATAKGVEDRAFWRYVPLASLGEVGGRPEPDPAADPLAALHAHHARTADRWPATLLAGTTHDVARAEDVRAIGLALADAGRGRRRRSSTRGPTGRARRSTSTRRCTGSPCRRVLTTPGIDVDRLHAFLAQGGARGGHAHVVDRPARRRTRRTCRCSPRRCSGGRRSSSWPRRCERPGRGDLARDARGAPDRARRGRPVPGHRGVPLRARRPRQPRRARPRRARRARRARRRRSTGGRRGPRRRSPAARAVRDQPGARRPPRARPRRLRPDRRRCRPRRVRPHRRRRRARARHGRAPRHARPAGAVELPPGRWRHVLARRRARRPRARSPSTPRSPRSRRSSCAAPDARPIRVFRACECFAAGGTRSETLRCSKHSDGRSAGEQDGGDAGDGEGAVVEHATSCRRRPSCRSSESNATVRPAASMRSTVGSAPNPSTSSDRSPSRRRSTTTASPWHVDGLLGVAAQHGDRGAAGRAARCRRRAPLRCGSVGRERRVEHGAGERRRVARVGDLLGPLVAELAAAALARRRPAAPSSPWSTKNGNGAGSAYSSPMNSSGVNGDSRTAAAATRRWRPVVRRAGAGRRVADVVVVAREHDEALERQTSSAGRPWRAAARTPSTARRTASARRARSPRRRRRRSRQ